MGTPTRPRRLLTVAVCLAVAVAFADSSIVVLALPSLYSAFDTTIVGVSWVITSYNLVVAVGAFLLVPLIRAHDAGNISRIGLLLFCAGSVGCALSKSLPILIAFRCVQGAGAAMLLAGTVALLEALTGSKQRAVALWIAAGTFGAAVGPALGGILTQLFDWQAIFVFQAPVALLALIAAFESHLHPAAPNQTPATRITPNVSLGFIFGALVGALFLAVLLVINVWRYSPIAGAAVVSALPLAALVAQRLTPELAAHTAAPAGALLLAMGLLALALLPRSSAAIVVVALGLCGTGMGLAVPVLTRSAVAPDAAVVHDATVTIGARHAGLVLALVLVAPVLSHNLQTGARNALLGGTKVLLGADVPIRQQVPVALKIRDVLDHAPKGTMPDLAAPFNQNGATHDRGLQQVRDSLTGAVTDILTRAFRPALALTALLAALALIPISLLKRRVQA